MGHWFDDAARGLAAGTHSRRDVVRIGGKAAGGALLATLSTPIGALAAGRHKCPHGHSCGSDELCCEHDCCDKRTEQCCDGRCVAKERTCCRHFKDSKGKVCRRHERCCKDAEQCYDPDEKECCASGLCPRGECCGDEGDCCEHKYCCDDEVCCSEEKPTCCHGKCCASGEVCCGGECCNKLDCVGDICEGSNSSSCIESCPPNTKCCAGDCTNTTLAPNGYYNTICCESTPSSPSGSTVSCNQTMGGTGSGCQGGTGGCICADGSFCPATQQCCYESGCCPPGQSCGIFTHACA
jgi:hypothetical protein